jgi:uncharacterized protein (AIM24 family)
VDYEFSRRPSFTHLIVTLERGEEIVARDDAVEFETRRVGGPKSTLLSGGGPVFEFTGPGSVWYQTRNLDALANVLAPPVSGDSRAGSRRRNPLAVGGSEVFVQRRLDLRQRPPPH